MHASTRIKPVTRNGVRVPVSAVCMPALPLQQPYILWPVRKPAGAATRHQPASVRPAAMHPHGTDSAIASGSSSTSPHPFPVAQPPSCPPAFPQSLSSPTTSGRVGVVIVDHGSRKSDSNAMLHEFAHLYQQVSGAAVVEVAHMEIAEPTIEQAIGRCAARGVTSVVIAPYFLSRGRHIQEDIPALVREAQALHPGLRCIIAQPIGIDPLMAQLISNRVKSVVSEAGLLLGEEASN